MTIDTKSWECGKCGSPERASHNYYCRPCWNTYQNDYRRERYRTDREYREKMRVHQRRVNYGITEDEHTELWAQQGGVCAICLLEPEGKELAVDHDHTTGEVRGLLCSKCNGGIAMFKEKLSLLFRAADYLVLHGSR